MKVKDLRRHLHCKLELDIYDDGVMALECQSCRKTLALFCNDGCGGILLKEISFEVRPRSKRMGIKKANRSKEFKAKVKAFCEYRKSNERKPLDFSTPDPKDLKGLPN
jgi:hypothetical protein